MDYLFIYVAFKKLSLFFRHTMDGKFTYVDQRVTRMLGYLPQELTGTSIYEHVQFDDIPSVTDSHRNSLKFREEVKTQSFHFRTKDGSFVPLQVKYPDQSDALRYCEDKHIGNCSSKYL